MSLGYQKIRDLHDDIKDLKLIAALRKIIDEAGLDLFERGMSMPRRATRNEELLIAASQLLKEQNND